MKNEFKTWLENNAPAGQPWKARLLSLAAAGMATALVGLSVVLMAGLGLPAGELPMEAAAPATARSVRYAQALPTVTVVGRREPAPAAPATIAVLPARPASGDAAARIAIAGDNLR
jgi:hypothetical protein